MNFLDSCWAISQDDCEEVYMTDEEYEQWERKAVQEIYMEYWNDLDEESRENIKQNQLLQYQRKNKANTTASPSSSVSPPVQPVSPQPPSHCHLLAFSSSFTC
jgi:hypothetical protein